MCRLRTRLYHIALGVGMCLSIGACDLLEVDPTSVITSDSFWQTESDAQGGLAGMYVKLRTESVENLFIWGELRSETLESEAIVGDNYMKYRENDLSASFGPSLQGLYSVVNAANLILTKVPEITFSSEDTRKLLLAQAHAMRAYVYFTMAKIWGGVPIRTEPMEKYDAATVHKARATLEEVFTLIKDDLKDALELFPSDAFETGRNHWSKASTLALKADVYLWTARRMNGGEADFQTALKACEDIQQIGGIRLLPDFKEVFTYDNKGNDEVLMAINYKKVEASNNYFDMMHISAATLSPDIEPDILETIGAGGGLMELSPSKHLRAQYSEEDSRRDVTFLEIYKTKDGGRSYYGTMAMKCRGIVESGVRYFVDDIILYRYADVLLMKAEAKNGLKQDPTAEMEEVRQRAYGENYANHKFVNGTPEENDAAILQERLLEFATECKRWWDLVRFDKAFELVPSLVGRDNQELLYFPIPNSVLSLEPLVEPNSAWPM